jgi:hypothetical protein
MKSAVFWGITQRRVAVVLPTFRDNVCVSSSRVKSLE